MDCINNKKNFIDPELPHNTETLTKDPNNKYFS